MVAGQHHSRNSSQGNPAGSFKGLGGLVDKQRTELLAVQKAIGRAYERGGNDTSLTKQLTIDAYLQFRGAALQTFQLLMELLITPSPMVAQVADSLADSPQMRIVGMSLKATLIGKRQHLVVHTRRITYS